MNKSDISDIVELENKYLGTTLGESYFNQLIDDPTACFLVLEENDNIVAYISSTIDEYSEILNFFVIKEAQRKGYGYLLLNEVIKRASGKSRSIYLEVNEHNEAAIALYLKCGFKIDHIRKNYYKDANAYAMIKEL